jgi:hypothetical protein
MYGSLIEGSERGRQTVLVPGRVVSQLSWLIGRSRTYYKYKYDYLYSTVQESDHDRGRTSPGFLYDVCCLMVADPIQLDVTLLLLGM